MFFRLNKSKILPVGLFLAKIKLDFAMDGASQKQFNALSDVELFAELASGEKGALAAIYDRYAAHLFGLATKILQDQQSAEDVLQDLFLYLWNNPDKFRQDRGNPASWLSVMCRNRCIDKLRSKHKKRNLSSIDLEFAQNIAQDESVSPVEIVNYKEVRTAFIEAFNQLPDEQREPIELAYFGGLSQTEVAAKLGVPLGTVKTRIRLAMQKLRSLLKESIE